MYTSNMPGFTRIIVTVQTVPSVYGLSCASAIIGAAIPPHSIAAATSRSTVLVGLVMFFPSVEFAVGPVRQHYCT